MASRMPVSPVAVRRLLTEVEASGRGEHFLAVGGAAELAPVLRRQFLDCGAEPAAVRLADPEGADVYVHVLAGRPTEKDEAALRRAAGARVPIIAVVAGRAAASDAIPYVLATDVVRVRAGEGFPLAAIARAIAARLEEDGAPLAAHVPLLREAVSERLVSAFARKNGLVAAAVWIRGADLPVLALNQLRLVLRIAQLHGREDARERLPELAAAVGAGVGLRRLAREAADTVPAAGWAVRVVVAYGGTRVLGAAARKRFELAGGAEDRAATRRPAGAVPAEP